VTLELALRVRFEEFDCIGHSQHAVSYFLRYLATKFVLELHNKFDSVEAIGAEIVDEISVFCYLIPIDPEMFGDNFLNPLADIIYGISSEDKAGHSSLSVTDDRRRWLGRDPTINDAAYDSPDDRGNDKKPKLADSPVSGK